MSLRYFLDERRWAHKGTDTISVHWGVCWSQPLLMWGLLEARVSSEEMLLYLITPCRYSRSPFVNGERQAQVWNLLKSQAINSKWQSQDSILDSLALRM